MSSGNRYTFSIENKLIITEILPCISQFGDQDKVFLKVDEISHFECSGELSEWRAVRGVVSGMSWLTIY